MEVPGSGALGRQVPLQAQVGSEALVSLLPSLWSWLGDSLSTFYPNFLLWTLASLASSPELGTDNQKTNRQIDNVGSCSNF